MFFWYSLFSFLWLGQEVEAQLGGSHGNVSSYSKIINPDNLPYSSWGPEREDYYGTSVCQLSNSYLVIGSPGNDDGFTGNSTATSQGEHSRATVDHSTGSITILSLDAAGNVSSSYTVSDTQGGFDGVLEQGSAFGSSVCEITDLNANGFSELAVGAPTVDGGEGAVWILFLDENAEVDTYQKISSTEGGFDGVLQAGDRFGSSVCEISDINADGISELVVGSLGSDREAVYILFLVFETGLVDTWQKISATDGGLDGVLEAYDVFSCDVSRISDYGIFNLAVGAYGDDDGATNTGAVYLFSLTETGTVDTYQKISAEEGGFDDIELGSNFGKSVSEISDLNGDGIPELAVGAGTGAVWILFMSEDGLVETYQKINMIIDDNSFGGSVCEISDLNGDGISELAVGAKYDDDGARSAGAVWILFLDAWCVPTEVANSDYSTAGSITGSPGDVVTVTCDTDYIYPYATGDITFELDCTFNTISCEAAPVEEEFSGTWTVHNQVPLASITMMMGVITHYLM